MIDFRNPLPQNKGSTGILTLFSTHSQEKKQTNTQPVFNHVLEGLLGALHTNAAVLDMSGTVLATNLAWQRFSNLGRNSMCVVSQNYFTYLKICSSDHPLTSVEFANALRSIIQQQTQMTTIELVHRAALVRIHLKKVDLLEQPCVLVQFEQIALPVLPQSKDLESLLEHLPDMVARFDDQCRFLYITTNFEQWSGLNHTLLIGQTMQQAGLSEELCQLWNWMVLEVFASGLSKTIEFEFLGSPYEACFVPEFNQSQSVQSVLVCTRGVTKQLPQTIDHARERRFRAMIEHSAEAITLLSGKGKVIYGSPSTEEILGLPLEQFLGSSCLAFIHPDDQPQAQTAFRKALLNPRLGITTEVRFCHGDGAWIWLAGTFTNLLHDPDVGAVIANYRDVSHKHVQAADLKAREEHYRFQAAFDQSPTGIAILGLDGSWKRINQAFAAMLGYSVEELKNLTIAAISHPDEHQADLERGLELTITGQLHYEKRFVHKNTSVVWARVHFSLVIDGANHYILKQIENITEEKRFQTEVQQLNFQLEKRLARLSALREIDTALVSSLDLSLTLGLILDQICKQLGVQAANVMLYYPESLSLRFYIGRGFRTSSVRNSWVRLGTPLGGLVGLDRMTMVIPNVFVRKDLIGSYMEFLQNEGIQSFVGLPLLAKGELLGVIEIYHHTALEPDHEMLEYLELLAGQAALAIENTKVLRALQYSNTELAMAYDETIEGWSRALDLRDKETEGHSRRVTEMTVRLARAMNINEGEIIQIRRGALLHDIGKMGVPDEILLKPGKLTDDEWVMMKKHPDYAHELLAPIGFLGAALDIPYAHHEKWDGTGYPRGLHGERIPLAARIFAVVDVWDALKSDRPYRSGWTTERVIEHITQSSGTHFDPRVVTNFLALLKQDQVLLCDEPEVK